MASLVIFIQSPPSGLIVQSPAASPQSTKRFGSVLGTKKAGTHTITRIPALSYFSF
jgi:hypothetical protein